MECGALTDSAFDANLSGVFLKYAVGDGEPKTRAAILAFARCVLGGEKRIVDATDVFLSDSGTGVRDRDIHSLAVRRGDPQSSSPARHGILRIQEQIQEHLLQAAGTAVNSRQVLVQV